MRVMAVSKPLKQRWFEDYATGEVFEFGQHTVTEDEIIEFARRYDPQSFHTDSEASKDSMFGGIIGSGWMSTALAMRMMWDHFIPTESALGSPGVDQLQWLFPVRPGDTLRMRASVLDTRLSQSKPDRGVVTVRQELVNQNNLVVMRLDGKSMHRIRPCD